MKKILIVEDNKDSSEILCLFITKIGHHPIKARNSNEAIILAEAEEPGTSFSWIWPCRMPMESRQLRCLDKIPKPLTFLSLRSRRKSPHYDRKRLGEWVSQPS